jgi:hypothetical protein
MASHSIEYLNARAAHKPASGGADHAVRFNPVDERARLAGLDPLDLAHEQVIAIFADFRAWFAESTNALRAGRLDTADDQLIPF